MKDLTKYGPQHDERKAFALAITFLIIAIKDGDAEPLTSMEILDRAQSYARHALEDISAPEAYLQTPVQITLEAARRALLQIGKGADPSSLVSDLIH